MSVKVRDCSLTRYLYDVIDGDITKSPLTVGEVLERLRRIRRGIWRLPLNESMDSLFNAIDDLNHAEDRKHQTMEELLANEKNPWATHIAMIKEEYDARPRPPPPQSIGEQITNAASTVGSVASTAAGVVASGVVAVARALGPSTDPFAPDETDKNVKQEADATADEEGEGDEGEVVDIDVIPVPDSPVSATATAAAVAAAAASIPSPPAAFVAPMTAAQMTSFRKIQFAMEYCLRGQMDGVRHPEFLSKVSQFFLTAFPKINITALDVAMDGKMFLTNMYNTLRQEGYVNDVTFDQRIQRVALSVLVGCILGHQHAGDEPSQHPYIVSSISSAKKNFTNYKPGNQQMKTDVLATAIWKCFADNQQPAGYDNDPILNLAHGAWEKVKNQRPQLYDASYYDAARKKAKIFGSTFTPDTALTWADLLNSTLKKREDPRNLASTSRTLLLLAGLLVLGTPQEESLRFLTALAYFPELAYTDKYAERSFGYAQYLDSIKNDARQSSDAWNPQ